MYWTVASAVGPALGRGSALCPHIYKQCEIENIQMLSANTVHNVELRVVQNEVTGTWFMDLTHYSLILHKLDGHYIT